MSTDPTSTEPLANEPGTTDRTSTDWWMDRRDEAAAARAVPAGPVADPELSATYARP